MVADRDGLYVAALASGTISFRYNYCLNGRQETIVLGRYGSGGITLLQARAKLDEARRRIGEGLSPAREKARARKRSAAAGTFGEWAALWLSKHVMADSTRDMRRSVYERELKPRYASLTMWEVTDEDLRSLCDTIVERGAPATAVHAREIVLLVFRFASERGNKDPNPAELVRSHTIAVFQPRDRALSSADIGSVYKYLEHVATSPVIRLAVKLLLLTMLRKSELIMGEWSEINFTDAVWTIPAKRMKRRKGGGSKRSIWHSG